MPFKYPFLTIINDLNPLTKSLVLVGGWVPTVYFEYLWRSPREFFKTEDVDLALSPSTLKDYRSIEKEIDLLSVKGHYSRKHLELGKEKPWQLIFESSIPIDFLADPKDIKKIRDKILGKDIILNESQEYHYLLESPLQVKCEGILVRVPQPVRYITHKNFVYLQDRAERKKDLATAYYCLTRSPDPDALFAELSLQKSASIMKFIKKQKDLFIESQTAPAIRDVQKSLGTIGVHEEAEDILQAFQRLF